MSFTIEMVKKENVLSVWPQIKHLADNLQKRSYGRYLTADIFDQIVEQPCFVWVVKEDENIIQGLKRETKEETQLEIREPIFLMKLDNLNFFYERYNSQPVKISHEHTDYKFFSIKELDKSEKFQRIAIKAIEESIK